MMKWFKLRKPRDLNDDFKGMTLTGYSTAKDALHRTNGERLKVESIKGNLTHQTMFEINGSHLVSMLDAYSELNKEPLPPKDLHEAFLSTIAESVRESKEPSYIDRKPTHV